MRHAAGSQFDPVVVAARWSGSVACRRCMARRSHGKLIDDRLSPHRQSRLAQPAQEAGIHGAARHAAFRLAENRSRRAAAPESPHVALARPSRRRPSVRFDRRPRSVFVATVREAALRELVADTWVRTPPRYHCCRPCSWPPSFPHVGPGRAWRAGLRAVLVTRSLRDLHTLEVRALRARKAFADGRAAHRLPLYAGRTSTLWWSCASC